MKRYLNGLLLGLTVCLIGAMLWAGWQVLDQPVTRIKFVSVLSDGEQSAIKDAIGTQGVGSVLSMDIESIQARLNAAGWTRNISVRRVWPDTLEVALAKQDPIARWGGDAYLTSVGSIVTLPDPHPDLPRIKATLSDPEDALRALRLIDRMAVGLTIVELEQNLQGEWRVGFEEGFDLYLGRDRLGDRVARFSRVHRWVASEDRVIDYVDARYGSGVAVKFKEEGEIWENALAADYRSSADDQTVEGASAHGGR